MKKALLYPAILLLLVILFFWKLTLSGVQYIWTDSPDLANQVLPWWNYQAREWQAGRFPAWEPNHWAGQPLVGQAQPGAAYPLNWLLFSTPLKNGALRDSYLNWYFVLVRFLAALNAYLLARYFARSYPAALLAGLVYSLGGFVGNTDWPQMVNGAVWMPLVLLFQAKALNGERAIPNAALGGVFLGLAWLAGHHQVPTFFTYAIGGIWIHALIRDVRRTLPLAATFGLFWVAMSAAQTFPAYEYAKLARRWVGASDAIDWKTAVPYFVHREYSAGLVSIFGVVLPGFSKAATTGFVGITAVALAAWAVVRGWTAEVRVRMLLAVALFGVLVAWGADSLLHGILYAIGPLIEKSRSPNMAMAVFDLAAAVLAAYGLDALRAERPATDRAAWIVGGAGLAILLPAWGKMLAQGRDSLYEDRILLSAMCALAVGALLASYRREAITPRFLTVALMGIVMSELYAEGSYHFRNRFQPWKDSSIEHTTKHGDIAAFLRAQTGQPFRVEVDDQKIPYNFGDWHGVEQINGYLASLTSNILRLDIGTDPARRLFGTRYWIGAGPQNSAQRLVFRGASGMNVYENPGVLPRAWSVHTILKAANDDEVRALLQNARVAVALESVAFAKASLPAVEAPFQCAGPDEIRLTSYEPGSRVRIAARMSCRGLVVLSETWFPGWEATIDGRVVEIHEVYGCLRGVIAERGDHVIEYRYRPASLRLGFALTAAAVVAAVVLIFRRRS